MANVLIGYENQVDAASLAGGAWSATLGLANLQDRVLSRVARSADAATSSTEVRASFPAAPTIELVALCAHSLSALATVRIRAYSEDTFTTVAYDSGALPAWPAGKLSGYNAIALHKLPAASSARWWRISIDDTTNPAGAIQVGRLFLGRAFQPAHNMSYGASIGYESRSTAQDATDGTEFFDVRDGFRVARFDLDYLLESEAMRVLDLQRQSDQHGEILYAWSPGETTYSVQRTFLGRLRRLSAIEHPYYHAHRVGWEVKETIGGSSVSSGMSTAPATGGAGGPEPYDIGFSVAGLLAADEVIRIEFPRACTMPSGFAGSVGSADTAATADCVLTVTLNSAPIGTITFAAGSAVAVFAGAASVAIAISDILRVHAPAVADATLADISISFMGSLA